MENQAKMKKNFLVILLLILTLSAFAQQKKVAVYVTGEDASLNKVVASKLVAAIARSEDYSVVERSAEFQAALLSEHSYERTGEVEENEIARIGKQYGVSQVCVANVFQVFGEQYISARIIDVESAQVVRTASSSGSVQTLTDLMNAASGLATDLVQYMGINQQKSIKRVAVYVPKNDASRGIGRVLGDKMVAAFVTSGRYTAVERTNSFLSQLKNEQQYQQNGAVDDKEISRIGKQFGVQYVCVADVSDVMGEKYISARMIDVETAEVVNTHDEGGKINDMESCLRIATAISNALSKGTIKEQAEEARLKEEAERERIRAAEEARKKAEQEEQARIKAEEEAKKKAEEEKQRQIDEEIAYIDRCIKQGYVELITDIGTYLIDLDFNMSVASFKESNVTYYKHGKNGCRLPIRPEFSQILTAFTASDFFRLCNKHHKYVNNIPIFSSKRKYWCLNGKVSWYFFMYYDYSVDHCMISRPDESHDFTYAFQDWHVKSSIYAYPIYIIKL